MHISHTLRAAVIGSGNIGAFFDAPTSKSILTHAHAYYQHEGFEIVGFVDSDIEKATAATRKWGGRAYGTVEELFSKEEVDVVSVCSSTASHAEILKYMESVDLLGGILEKPLAETIEDAKVLSQSFNSKKGVFIFNFKRRFLPEFRLLSRSILEGKYGALVSGHVTYGKGLRNNAIHAFDVFRFFGIDLSNIHFAHTANGTDFEIVFGLKSGGALHVSAVPTSLYKIFEFDFYFEKARIRILDEGSPIEVYCIQNDTLFSGYRTPVLDQVHRSSADCAMKYVVENLYDAITQGTVPLCTVYDGYHAQQICEDVDAFNKNQMCIQ